MNHADYEKPVIGQLEAYNRRHLDQFCSYFTDDIELYMMGEPLPLFKGQKAFRENYRKRFSDNLELHAEIKHRVILPPYLVDHEIVSGIDGKTIHAVAIYRVQGEKIDRVWFVR